jgi:hypothetical protein
MKETVLTWTIANWITVFLMFISASLVIGLVFKGFTKLRGGMSGDSNA